MPNSLQSFIHLLKYWKSKWLRKVLLKYILILHSLKHIFKSVQIYVSELLLGDQLFKSYMMIDQRFRRRSSELRNYHMHSIRSCQQETFSIWIDREFRSSLRRPKSICLIRGLNDCRIQFWWLNLPFRKVENVIQIIGLSDCISKYYVRMYILRYVLQYEWWQVKH